MDQINLTKVDLRAEYLPDYLVLPMCRQMEDNSCQIGSFAQEIDECFKFYP